MATNPSLFNSVARKPSLPPASILLPNWISGDDHRSDLLGVAFSIRPSTRPSAVFGRSFYLPIARFLGRRLGSMEKELLETFEAAKKAADLVAEAAECSPEVDRCIDGLRRLKKIPVTKQYLVETQVGKRLRYLTKHKHSKIQVEASSLLELWKNIVIQEMKNGSCENKSSVKNIKSGRTDTVKFDKTSKNEHANMNGISTSDSIKNENMKSERNKMDKNISNDSEKMSKGSYEASIPKKPSSAGSAGPPKLPAMLKCNDPVRDKIRELLAEAFSKVSQETGTDERDEVRNILDEVEARDPIRAAVMVESVMFEKLGRSNGSQKLKYRSVMFNLRDSSNTDLRRRVLLGEVKPERLIVMAPEEMASDKRRQSNEQIKEKALFECERGGAPKATTDEFKCGRCGERKTTYYQMQTRSADEPMTTFVTCVNCNNHWKFC